MTEQKQNSDSCGHDQANAQHARFLETACALGCDENEAAFDEKLKAMVPAKPKEQKPNGA